ncbi:MAG: glycosyl transferase family 2 [Verrucomicrobia bacterium]|nr:glycosyl transferase family 2 [Verrucomicrobiota bacterium]
MWAQQDFTPEVIVIDGASTDGTREWLERNRTRLGALVSEPDDGVYVAMNKGVALARSEWVLFLGADDVVADGTTLAEVASHLRSTDAGVVVGEAVYQDNRIYRLASAPHPLARNFVHHQGAFYRRSLFHEQGSFDPTLRVMADYDFNLRLWRKGLRFQPINLRVARCGQNGISDRGHWRGYREEIAIRHRYFSGWKCWLWDIGSVVRFVRKKVVVMFR